MPSLLPRSLAGHVPAPSRRSPQPSRPPGRRPPRAGLRRDWAGPVAAWTAGRALILAAVLGLLPFARQDVSSDVKVIYQGWAQLPASRQLLRRIGAGTDTLTYLGEYTRSRIASAVGPEAAARWPGPGCGRAPCRCWGRPRTAASTWW